MPQLLQKARLAHNSAILPEHEQGKTSTLLHRERVPELLQKMRLAQGGVRVEGTPRRLAVLVSGLAPRQEDATNRMRGPPAKVRVHMTADLAVASTPG